MLTGFCVNGGNKYKFLSDLTLNGKQELEF